MPYLTESLPSLVRELGYVDGGTGSMVFQAMLGGLLTAAYFFTSGVRKLKALFGRSKRESESRRQS
jgi:hypothetical protein